MVDYPHQWYGGQSYAQHGDDYAVINIFKRLSIEQPSYLDIGAHHPFELSNTALLYQRGCRGINVEANPDLIPTFNQERPEDQNVWAAIVPPDQIKIVDGQPIATLYRINETSGINSTIKDALKSHGGPRDTVTVPAKTIGEIITKYANNRWPDFVSIDCEGCDAAILQSIDWDNHFHKPPKVILVEAVSQLGDQAMELRSLLNSIGYYCHSWCGCNMLFTHIDCKPFLH